MMDVASARVLVGKVVTYNLSKTEPTRGAKSC